MENLEPIFQSAHRQLKPRSPLPAIKVEFFPFAGLNHTARLHEGRLIVRLSDIFTDAPVEIYYSLALILLAKLYRRKVDLSYHRTYRTFILRSEIQERARLARSARGRATHAAGSKGRHIDLDALFDSINLEYFGGALEKPRLSWSRKRSRYTLGRYDSTHQVIYISRVFDSPAAPPYVVAYVMFHEMLHLKHQSRVHDSRIIVHTREFKDAERSFAHYQEAKLWLKGI